MINILWLYGSVPKFDVINHWYHTGFAKVLSEMPNVNLMLYGYGMERLYPDMTRMDYNENITGKDIKKEFNFDVIIMDNKQRFLSRTHNSRGIRKFWLAPYFFNGLGETPKIMLEGDYTQHIMRAGTSSPEIDWYVNRQVDLLLVRHLDNLKHSKTSRIPLRWFPCSVNNTIFKPNPEIERIEKICLISGYGLQTYKYRTLAGKVLSPTKLVDIYQKRFIGDDYIQNLQSYSSHISGSGGRSGNHITAAKMFEIMASGSVLLTDKGEEYGLKELFPGSSYCTYKRDGSDIITKSELIINEPDYREFVTNRAIKCISEKHTHEIRAQELIDLMVDTFGISLNTNSSLFKKIQALFFDKNKEKEVLADEPEKIVEVDEPEKIVEVDVPENKNEKKLKELHRGRMKIYLLKDTCYDILINNKIGDNLNIAVSNRPLAKEILGDDFTFCNVPANTRRYKYKGMVFHIPYKVVDYLKNLYGRKIIEELEQKDMRLWLKDGVYTFGKRT